MEFLMITYRQVFLALLFCFLCLGTYKSLTKFFKSHIETMTSYKYRSTMQYPSLTICPLALQNEDLDEAYILHKFKNWKSIADKLVWKLGQERGHYKRELLFINWFNDSEQLTIMEQSPVRYTFLAQDKVFMPCILYEPPEELPGGVFEKFELHVNVYGLVGAFVAAHDKGQYYPTLSDFYGSDYIIMSRGESISTSMGVKFKSRSERFERRLVTRMSTDESPCLKEGANLEQCIVNYVESKLDCKLPWSQLQDRQPNHECQTKREIMDFYELSRNLSRIGTRKMLQTTDCLPPCSTFHYDSTLEAENMLNPHPIPRGLDGELDLSGLFGFFMTANYEEDMEVPAYGMRELVADFGCYLGLSFGISILDISSLFL